MIKKWSNQERFKKGIGQIFLHQEKCFGFRTSGSLINMGQSHEINGRTTAVHKILTQSPQNAGAVEWHIHAFRNQDMQVHSKFVNPLNNAQ